MKFAHLGDCHLGGWRFPELQELSMQSFEKAIDICIKEKVEMILIAGDLFDSAYPEIEILKKTFKEFKKINDSKIPCFIIPGSHDYSISGKTFLDVLENAGFCTIVQNHQENQDKIILQPLTFGNYALYGYPGKKSGMEIQELKKIQIQDAPGFFKILMLHTAIKEAIGNLPIESISINELPKVDYYALGHLHINFTKNNLAYSGPTFPNNFDELEELKYGQFQIIEYDDFLKIEKISLKIKETLPIKIEITNTLIATEKILNHLSTYNLNDKIVLLKLHGEISHGKTSNIRFNEVEQFIKEKKAYVLIKSISQLKQQNSQSRFEIKNPHKIEDIIIKEYLKNDDSEFKPLINSLIKSLTIEKHEDETNQSFQTRLLEDLKKTLKF